MEKLQKIKETHLEVAAELGLAPMIDSGILNDLFVEAEWLLEDEIEDSFDYIYDQIVAIGELLSTRLVHAYLSSIGVENTWLDARDVIKTDDTYREGRLDWEQTKHKIHQLIRPLIDQGELIVLAGFIGSTPENNNITLGREGSDYTGAIIASILKTESLTVWKDVPGIMTADPDLFPDARLLSEIDYEEAIEMTFYGAKVIHPKTIKPLMDSNIPLLVRSFANPSDIGTTVSSFSDLEYPTIKVLLQDRTLLQLFSRDFTFIFEDHLSTLFRLAVENKIRIQLMENLALNLSLVIESNPENISAFIHALENDFKVVQTDNLELYTIRHYDEKTMEEIKTGRKIYIEEYNATTAQLLLHKLE